MQAHKKKNHGRVGTNFNIVTFSHNVEVGSYIAIKQMRPLKPAMLHVQTVRFKRSWRGQWEGTKDLSMTVDWRLNKK